MMIKKEYKIHDYLINEHESLVPAKNDELQVDERRYSDMLSLTAGGTLVMAIWVFLKSFFNAFNESNVRAQMEDLPITISAIGIVIIFAIFFVIAMAFRFYIWRGARKEAKDGKQSNGYLVCAGILMAFGIYSISFFIRLIINEDVGGIDVSQFLFDIVSFAFLCELMHSAIRLRKVREEIKEEN